jgi:hypothetical protein
MNMIYRVTNIFNDIYYYFSRKVEEYKRTREYKKLVENKNFKKYYVCNVSNIQSAKKIFLTENDKAYLNFCGTDEFFVCFSLSEFINENKEIFQFGKFEKLIDSGNFWLASDPDDVNFSELEVKVEVFSFLFSNDNEYEKFVNRVNEEIQKEKYSFGRKSSQTVMDFFYYEVLKEYFKLDIKHYRPEKF